MKIFILLMLVPIEFMGHFIKAFVLAVRLFANILAGHMVLGVLMLFIVAVRNAAPPTFWGVTGVTVFGVVALEFARIVRRLPAGLYLYLPDCALFRRRLESGPLIWGRIC